MKKQANFGSIIESFKKQLKVASDETQGHKEESIALGKSDSEVTEYLPTPGQNNESAETQRGVESGEQLPDAPKGIPVQQRERKECSPCTKIASPIDELVERLKGNLKVAAEQAFTTKDFKAEEPKKDESSQSQEKVEVSNKYEAGDNPKEHVKDLEKEASETPVEDTEVPVAEKVTHTGSKGDQKDSEGGEGEVAHLDKLESEALDTKRAEAEEGAAHEASETKSEEKSEQSHEKQETKSEESSEHESGEDKKEAASKEADSIDINELAQKTAEFIRYSDMGYEMAKALMEQLPVEKTASVDDEEEQALESAIAERVENLKQAGFNDDQILAQLELDGQADAAAMSQPTIEDMVNHKVAALQSAGVSDEEIMRVLQKDAEADSQQLAQILHQAISELEQAVEAGQLTEEQALGLLQESGLDVQGLLQAASGGQGANPGVAAEAAQEGEPVAEEAAEKKEPSKDEGEEAEKAENKKDESGKKEAELSGDQKKIDVNHNGKIDGDDLKKLRDKKPMASEEKKEAAEIPADPGAAGASVPSGLDQLPPEIQKLVQEIDSLLQSGAISEQQAMAIIDSLFQGQAGAEPSSPGATPTPAPVSTPAVA